MRTRHAILLATALLVGALTIAASAMAVRVQERPRPGELWEKYPLNPTAPPVAEAPSPAASEPSPPPAAPEPSQRPTQSPLPPGVVDDSISPPVADGPKELPAVVNALLLAAALLILLAVATPLRHVLIGASTGLRRRSTAWRARFIRAGNRPARAEVFPSIAERIADYGQRRSLSSPSIETHPGGPSTSMVWSTPAPREAYRLPRLGRRRRLGPALVWALGVFVVVVVGLVIGVFL
jgi:hypothetical protein